MYTSHGRRTLSLIILLVLSATTAPAQDTERGLEELSQGRVTEAIRLLTAAVEADANDTRAVRGLAYAYLKAGRIDAATLWLRRTLELRPADAESRFELARILSWHEGTREEAYGHFEQALAARPYQVQYRLAYAEALSWEPGRQMQAIAEYEKIAQLQPHNLTVQAQLAQVWSWRGKLTRAEKIYDKILAVDPDSDLALTGKGEVLAWSGRSFEAARVLDQVIPAQPDSRWLLARANASYGIGRPDEAAGRLAILFSVDPGNPYAVRLQEAIDDWREPRIDLGFSFMRGSGDPTTSQVEFNRPFAQVHFPVNAWSRARVSYAPTNYFNQASRRRENLVGIGWEGQPHDNFRFQARLRAARHTSGPGDLTGGVQLGWLMNDRVQLDFGFAREIVLDSVQAVAGVVAEGVLIGRARSNLVNFQLRYLVPRQKVDFFFRHSIGSVTGISIDSNRRMGFDVGAGKTVGLPRGHYLRFGYVFTFFGFDKDLGAFPSPTPTATTGGYFSPTKFFNNAGEIHLSGKLARRWSYTLGGYLGAQQAETLSSGLGQKKLSSYARTTHTVRLTQRISVIASYEHINVGGAFQRTTASLGVRVYLKR